LPGKIDPAIKQQALAQLAISDNLTQTAKKLKIAKSTLHDIKKSNIDRFEQIRTQKQAEMIANIWDNLIDAQQLGHNMIKEALEGKRDNIQLHHVSTYFGTLYDKQALMSGQPTANIAIDHTIEAKLASDAESAELIRRLYQRQQALEIGND
jgi:hypothetical protein